MIFALSWVVGDRLRTRRAYYAELEERAARLHREREAQSKAAVAAERARIARELHDVVAHNVSVMVVQADGAAYVLDAAPDQAKQALATISATGRQALAEMRRLLGLLRAGDDAGGEYLPQPGVDQLEDLIDQVRGAGLPVRFEVAGNARPLSSGVELTAYRIVQEALTNVRKHGGEGASARVLLDFGEAALDLLIEDDGRGPLAPYDQGGRDGLGQGLIGMRERIGMVGGTLDAGPRPGGGFRISAVLPLKTGGSSLPPRPPQAPRRPRRPRRLRQPRRPRRLRPLSPPHRSRVPSTSSTNPPSETLRVRRAKRYGDPRHARRRPGAAAHRLPDGAGRPAGHGGRGRGGRWRRGDRGAALHPGGRGADGCPDAPDGRGGGDPADLRRRPGRAGAAQGSGGAGAAADPKKPAGPRVLILTTFDLDEYAFAALRAGASGFLLKDVPPDELLTAIRAVHSGDAVVAPSTTRRLLDRFTPMLPSSGADQRLHVVDRLTEREREVLLLVAQGLSNGEIARKLVLSEATVKTHVGRILTKLELRDRVQAVVLAYESGLIRAGSGGSF